MKTYSKEQKVKIGEYTATFKRMPLGQIAELMNSIEDLEIPDELMKMTNDQLAKNLPKMVASFFPFFAEIVAKTANQKEITKEYIIKNAYLDQMTTAVEAIARLNRLDRVFGGVKNLTALFGSKTE